MPTLPVVYPSFDLVVQMQRKAGRPFNQVMLLNTDRIRASFRFIKPYKETIIYNGKDFLK